MNYDVSKSSLSEKKLCFEGCKEIPLDIDFTLPDYSPDVQKILKCLIKPNINSRNISGGQIKGFSLDIDCLSPYLNDTYLKNVNILKEKYKSKVNDEMIKTLANDLTKNELKNGVQTIHYQINTLINSGGTVPLVTLKTTL